MGGGEMPSGYEVGGGMDVHLGARYTEHLGISPGYGAVWPGAEWPGGTEGSRNPRWTVLSLGTPAGTLVAPPLVPPSAPPTAPPTTPPTAPLPPHATSGRCATAGATAWTIDKFGMLSGSPSYLSIYLPL